MNPIIKFSLDNNVPCVKYNAFLFLKNIAKDKKLLELGSAFGVSAIAFLDGDCREIFSVEGSLKAFDYCSQNILDNRAKFFHGDCFEYLSNNDISDFDIFFVDHTKRDYARCCEYIYKNMKKDAIIIVDNTGVKFREKLEDFYKFRNDKLYFTLPITNDDEMTILMT